jgi:thiol-disulfide isomerase/thioredoxin
VRLLSQLHHKHCLILLLTAVLHISTAVAEQQASVNDYKLKQLARPLPAADFKLLDMEEKTHTLKQYRGKVVLINFWATWCPPCIDEMPSLEKLYQKLKGQPFVMLAINQWEDEERVFEFMGELSTIPNFPILFDPDSKVSAAFGVQGLPSSFIVDKQGRIVYRATGGRDFAHPEIEAKIKSLF